MNRVLLLFILPGLMCAQFHSSIHERELIAYGQFEIDFNAIDGMINKEQTPPQTRTVLSHEIIGYLPYWQYDFYPEIDYNLLTQINYFAAELTETGDISNTHGWPYLGMISFAQGRGVKVKLCATLFGSASLTAFLSNEEYRQNAVTNLLNLVVTANADGIDIDFESVPESQRENLVSFMSDLAEEFRAIIPDAIITMATPAVDWWGSWDYEALAEICDGLFIMGYDYHWPGSATAGPVSPLGGFFYDVEYSVYDYLDKTDGNSEKIILGVPYYGYDWPVVDASMYSPTTGNADARIYSTAINMAENYGNSWDISSNANWISYNETGWQQCWYDDSISLSLKYQFALENDLAGVGMWALGYDNGYSDLWGALAENFSGCEPTGDINDDNSTDILDIVTMVNYILNITEFDDYQICVGDMNLDEEINILDIINVVNLILENS